MSEETRNSVATGISMLGLFIQQLMEEEGLEKTLGYYKKLGYAFGSGTAANFKERFGARTPTPEELKKALETNYSNMGMDMQITTKSDGIEIKINKCPFYQGLSMSGMDHDAITKFCKEASSGEYAAVTEAYPKLEVFSNPRSHENGVCIEGYKIKR